MTNRLTDAEIADLVARFDTMSMGEWDRDAVERAAAGLGRPSGSDGTSRLTFVGPLPHGRSRAHRGHVLGSPREGCFTSLECDLARGEDVAVVEAVFRTVKTAVEARMGPAPIVRSPGPVLRWRRPETLLEIEWDRNGVQLRLLATKVVEKHEHALAEWGERDDCVAELGVWQGYIHRHPGLLDAFIPGVRRAETWEELGRGLRETLEALLTDLGRLDEDFHMVIQPTDEDAEGFVQFACGPDELTLEAADGVLAPLPGSRTGPQLGSGPSRLAEIRIPNPRPSDAEPAAQALVRALRAQNLNLDDLGHMAWLSLEGDYAPHLIGLGLPEIS
ncbi:hypothetical protein [Embleya sp. MST-111070]|uniref:hypothetical protein n=1 Tax=Embleya sp. MST-111070 TaxID=3398231 RepID=UPI003F741FE3